MHFSSSFSKFSLLSFKILQYCHLSPHTNSRLRAVSHLFAFLIRNSLVLTLPLLSWFPFHNNLPRLYLCIFQSNHSPITPNIDNSHASRLTHTGGKGGLAGRLESSNYSPSWSIGNNIFCHFSLKIILVSQYYVIPVILNIKQQI